MSALRCMCGISFTDRMSNNVVKEHCGMESDVGTDHDREGILLSFDGTNL